MPVTMLEKIIEKPLSADDQNSLILDCERALRIIGDEEKS